MPRDFLRRRRLVSNTDRFVGGTRMAHVGVGHSRRFCDVRDMSAWGLIPEMPVSDFAVAQTVLTSGASPAAFLGLAIERHFTVPPVLSTARPSPNSDRSAAQSQ